MAENIFKKYDRLTAKQLVLQENLEEKKIAIEAESDEIEELIDRKDRKFVYLIKEYNYRGEKYLISNDSDFFPRGEKKERLREYQKRYNFTIMRTKQFVAEKITII